MINRRIATQERGIIRLESAAKLLHCAMPRWFALGFLMLLAAARSFAGDTPTTFSLVAPKAKEVFLAGEFNHWSTTATPMKRDADGRWSATVSLPVGKHGYKFFVDGKWEVDEANPERRKDGFGGFNSVKTVADLGVDPVVNDKDNVRREAMRAFAKNDFAQIEKTAALLRESKARFSDGLWKLKEYLDGLKARNDIGEEKDWRPWFQKIDEWREEFPDSITLPVVLARGWLDYAAESHDQTSDDAVQNARTVLELAANLPARDPHWYAAMEEVAVRAKWASEDFDKLLNEAAAAEPTYYNYYQIAAEYAFGHDWDRGTLDRVAEKAAALDPDEGRAAYARTVWFMENHQSNVFADTTVTWPKLRQGFLDMQKAYPNSRWNTNAFCRYAVLAKDRETAWPLFKQIGAHGDPNWDGYGRYEMARIWADPATPSWRTEPVLTIAEPSKAEMHTVAFSNDGRLIASGASNGAIALWDAATGQQVWSADLAPLPVTSVKFSPDGKLLAAVAGDTWPSKRPGIAKVWDLATKEEVASAQPTGVVWRVAFTPDSRTLALVGGHWETQAEATLLDLTTHETRALPWTKDHDHILKGVAISPDGKLLATDCYQSITVWSLAEERVVFDTRNLLRDFVLSLTFSPDGKTLATCGGQMRGHYETEPGELTLWDTTTWKPRNPRTQDDAGGLIGVAFSPDGKLIAAGGDDRAAHVWDAATLQPKTTYVGHDNMIWAVAFSPDGKTLASSSADGTIKLWKLP